MPVTLFEIDELWALTSEPLLQSHLPAQGSNADGPAPKARKTQQAECMNVVEQRVILVTEPHTGFVVVLDSGHTSPLDIDGMEKVADSGLEKFWSDLATVAFEKYRALTLEYLCNYSDPTFLTIEEQGQVIQSGLALSPIAWAHTRYTVLFPPPLRGGWPKHGHDGKLSDRLTFSFEQGALPALSLPGVVVTRVLPGDSSFQATHILPGYMRPAVVHGYGGAKVDLPASLPDLAELGWTTLGASLLGTLGSLPQWCKKDCGDSVWLAPGCDVSFRATPFPLSLPKRKFAHWDYGDTYLLKRKPIRPQHEAG